MANKLLQLPTLCYAKYASETKLLIGRGSSLLALEDCIICTVVPFLMYL